MATAGIDPAGRAPASLLLLRFGSLGDVVLTFGAGAALARALPDARLTYLVKSEYAPLVRAQPWVHEVWELPEGEGRGASAARELRERVHAARFDVLVDWQTSPRSRYLTRGHARVVRWNAARWNRRRWVTLRWTRPSPVRPTWLRYRDAVAPLLAHASAAGIAPSVLAAPPASPAVAWDATAEGDAARFFEDWPGSGVALGERPVVAFAPGARWATKRWPEESFLALGRALVEQGAAVMLAGDGPDRAALPSLVAWARAEPAARWFDGTLPALAAAFARTRLVIANDTGLLHLAAAAGVSVLALFGSTHPALGFAPAGRARVLEVPLGCRPCTLHGRRSCPLGHFRCMRDLSVDRVLAAALEALAATPVTHPGAHPAVDGAGSPANSPVESN